MQKNDDADPCLPYVMLLDAPLHNLKWFKNSLALSQVLTLHSVPIWYTASLQMKTHHWFPYMMGYWSWSFHYEFVLCWRINPYVFKKQCHFFYRIDILWKCVYPVMWFVSHYSAHAVYYFICTTLFEGYLNRTFITHSGAEHRPVTKQCWRLT